MKMRKATKNTLLATLAVILLLAIALTTATFAWFSSNSSVTAGTTLFEASHDAAGGNLMIYWGSTQNGTGNSITMDAVNGMLPMCPTTSPAVGVSTLNGGAGTMISYVTAAQEGTVFGNPSTATAARLTGMTANDPPVAQNFFTIENPSDTPVSGGVTIKMDSLESDTNLNNDILRIAVYQNVNGTFVYRGTLCDGVNALTHYGAITAGQSIDAYGENAYLSTQTVAFADTAPSDPTVFLAPGGKMQVALIAWYDGQLLNSDRAGGSAQMKFTISVI